MGGGRDIVSALPGVEILICTHNRADLLQRVLDSLNHAERPDGCDIGIVVVANNCTDDTSRVLRSYEQAAQGNGWLPLRWFEEPTPGKSHALNRAFGLLESDVTALVDDDHRVDSGYLCAIARAVTQYPDTQLFCGRILPDWDGTEPAWVHDDGRYRIYPLPVPRFDQGDGPRPLPPGSATPGGGNLFFRRAVLERVGKFAADLGPIGHNLGGAEDIEWVGRARAAGLVVQYVPDVVQYHYVDPERLKLGYLVRKAFERSASTVQVASEERDVERFPRYMLRKIASYCLGALLSLSQRRRRFYLVRIAASAGELKGFLSLRADRKKGIVRGR